MNIYAFKDTKIGFMEPFLQQNDAVAKRTFTQICTEPEKAITRYKEDIELWKLGEYNEITGDIIPGKEYMMGGKDI